MSGNGEDARVFGSTENLENEVLVEDDYDEDEYDPTEEEQGGEAEMEVEELNPGRQAE